MTSYDLLTADGRVLTMTGTDPEHAARRAADLHQTTIVATRPSRRPVIRVGIPEENRP